MHWVFLLLAGLFEIGFTACLKLSDGFKRPWPTALFVVSAGISFLLLNLAIVEIPLGTAYAIWTGIGAAGTAAVGIIAFKERATVARVVLISLLIAAVVGLKFVSKA